MSVPPIKLPLVLLLVAVVLLLVQAGGKGHELGKEEHVLGGSVNLKCPSNKPVRTAVWDFNGKHIVTDNNKYTVSKKRLTISRLDLRDKGRYKCTLRFYNSSQPFKHNIHLDVLYPPVILKKPSTAPVLEGQELKLSCMADGNPAVKHEWLKEKMITELIRAKVKLSENSQNLTIPRIKKADEGRYFCKVSNSLGTKETPVDVKILIPPSIKLSSSRIIQAENSSVNIICETTGTPLPKLLWVVNSKEIMPSNEHSIRLQPGVTIFTIPSLKKRHAGNISCEARNSAGFNSSTASVTVQYIPQVHTGTKEIRAWPNLHLSLSCNITSEPLAHVTWYKNSQVISSSAPNTSVSSIKLSQQLLSTTLKTFLDSDFKDREIFSCEARNIIGISRQNISVVREALPEQPEIEFIDEGHESVRIVVKTHTDDALFADAEMTGEKEEEEEEEEDYEKKEEEDEKEEEEDEKEEDVKVYSNEDDDGGFDDVRFKEVKIKKSKNEKQQRTGAHGLLHKGTSQKELFKRLNEGNDNHIKLPLLSWMVTLESSEDPQQRNLVLPYASELFLDNLLPRVMYNVTIVTNNFVGNSAPLHTQVFTSDAPIYTIDRNVSLYRGGHLVRKMSKKLPMPPSSPADTDVASGFGFFMLVGIGSLIVLLVIFVLIVLVLYWQKRSLEKAKLLGKCPHHNVVTTLTRHDLEPHRCEQESLNRRGDRVADLTVEATATAHLSPIGYYKGDTVDDVIDHLNSSFCNK